MKYVPPPQDLEHSLQSLHDPSTGCGEGDGLGCTSGAFVVTSGTGDGDGTGGGLGCTSGAFVVTSGAGVVDGDGVDWTSGEFVVPSLVARTKTIEIRRNNNFFIEIKNSKPKKRFHTLFQIFLHNSLNLIDVETLSLSLTFSLSKSNS